MSALKGLRVVELANGLAGSVAGVLLADYGAEVVKVSRHAVDKNGVMAFRYRNKGSLVVDFDAEDDTKALASYLRGADVILLADEWVNFPFPDAVRQAMRANSAALMVKMPTTWLNDPVWAGDVESHGLLCAYAAISSRQMSCDGSPVEMINPYILYIHGIWAAASILSTLFAMEDGEAGQEIIVSGIQATMITSSASIAVNPNGEETSTAAGAFGKHPTYRPFKASCGNWVASGALGRRFVELFIETLGLGHIIDEPRVGGDPDAVTFPQNFEWSTELFEKAFLTDTAENWERKFRELGIPVELIRTREGLFQEEQVRANGIDWSNTSAAWGDVVTPANPVVLGRTPPSFGHMPECDDRKAGPFWPEKPAPKREVCTRTGPLQGVKVLNLGTFVATPMAGFLLSELGADVIKVEDLEGDPFRATGYSFNRGMRSLAITLKKEEGRDLFRALSEQADVAINGMRPGKMAKLGLDHDRLAQKNPGIISISLSAYGAKGPKAMLPGVDMVIQGLTGIMAAQGTPDAPYVSSAAYVDVASACISGYATALALLERKYSGSGQSVEEALLRSAVFMQASQVTSVNGQANLEQGYTDYKGQADHDRLHKASDRWIRIAARNADQVRHALGLRSGQSIETAIAGATADSLVQRLSEAGIPAVAVYKVKEVLRNRRFICSGQIAFTQGELHTMPMTGRLASFSGGQKGELLLPPGTGEHTEAVLAEAGLPDNQIAALAAQETVHIGVPMPKRFGLTYR